MSEESVCGMCNQGVQSDGMCPCGNFKIENIRLSGNTPNTESNIEIQVKENKSRLPIPLNEDSSIKLSNFFITAANVLVILGFVVGILTGSQGTPSGPIAFIARFLMIFLSACLGAAMLAFFGHVLRALKKIAEK
jgi:hypothetical protein